MPDLKLEKSIIESLVKGSITFNDAEEYQKILHDFPGSPHLQRLFADHLKDNKSFIDANKKYREAYSLFMNQGDSLQAITALLHGWEIVAPTPTEYRSLYSQLRRKDSQSSAIAECFAKMSYRELVAVLAKLEPVKIPAKEIVQATGEPENSLCFIVSGELIKTPPGTGKEKKSEEELLQANDHLGDIYPYEEKETVSSLITSRTVVELLKISQPDLLTLCGEYPDLEAGMKNLLLAQALAKEEKPASYHRKTSRRQLAIMLSLDILDSDPGRHPLSVKGFTSDISLGGICVIIDPRYRDIPVRDLINRQAKIRISLPDETISLTIMGRMAWYKETEIDGQPTIAAGVQFREMPPKLRGLLIVFANAVGTMTKTLEVNEISQDSLEDASRRITQA